MLAIVVVPASAVRELASENHGSTQPLVSLAQKQRGLRVPGQAHPLPDDEAQDCGDR